MTQQLQAAEVARQRHIQARDERWEEIEHLHQSGASPMEIARRLNTTVMALSKQAYDAAKSPHTSQEDRELWTSRGTLFNRARYRMQAGFNFGQKQRRDSNGRFIRTRG